MTATLLPTRLDMRAVLSGFTRSWSGDEMADYLADLLADSAAYLRAWV